MRGRDAILRVMRIASLQPSVSVTLMALGRVDAICACTKYCIEAVPALAADGIAILSDGWNADTAQILAAKPDLVIASVPYRLETLAAILRSGLPILTLAPHCLKDIYSDTRLIACMVDAEERYTAVVSHMEETIAATEALSATADSRPLVYCEEWGKPLIHSQFWVKELVEAAGGRFLGAPGSHTTADDVAAADPDVLVFSWCGAGERVPLEKVVAMRGWEHLGAVRNGRVHCVPDEFLNTPAVTLLNGLGCLAAILHPDRFMSDPSVTTLRHCRLEVAGPC